VRSAERPFSEDFPRQVTATEVTMGQQQATTLERPSAARRDRGDVQTAGQLLEAARCGDDGAWAELMGRLGGLVHATVRGFRLQDSDVEDVAQITWLLLYQNAHRIRNADAVPGWLTKTAARESLRVLTRRTRERVSDDGDLRSAVDDRTTPEAQAISAELGAALRAAVAGLPERRQQLVWTLAARSASYAELAQAMSMPVGSIGPTWQRCLRQLRLELQAHGFTASW
jgi:RNA polymerase sigma factor (sigma-70 family)